jgi:multisubunit Na+/H+ antiporter MnhG subunit
MKLKSDKRAGTVLHIGGPLVLLLLVVLFVFISITNPDLSNAIVKALTSLFSSIKG